MSDEVRAMPAKNFVSEFTRYRLALLGSVVILITVLIVIFAPVISPYNPSSIIASKLQSPNTNHLFGTDNLGRDIFSRVIWGARISILVGVSVALLSSLIGILLGSLAGYYGGIIDLLITKICEIFLVIPTFFLYIMVAATLRSRSTYILIVMLSVTMWPTVARIVRGEFLSLKERAFVTAAKSLGCSDVYIILHHLLPNTMASIIVTTTSSISEAILTVSALGFLGLGNPTAIEWGNMLQSGGRVMRHAWWAALFPGGAIFIVSLAFNIIGDGIRDALDPRLREV